MDYDLLLSTMEVDDIPVAPPLVPNRYVQVDADFLSYWATFDEEVTLDEMKHNCIVMVEEIMAATGAEHAVLHITAEDSDKAGRYDIATVQPYQQQRTDKPKPKLLYKARDWLGSGCGGKFHSSVWKDREADDGMSKTHRLATENGIDSVIWSKDKDLRMNYGKHFCQDTGKIIEVDGFGWVDYDSEKSKLIGYGDAFFFGQLLGGDSADTIPGLPKLSFQDRIKYFPTKAEIESQRRVDEGTMPSGKKCTEKQLEAALNKISTGKDKLCGLGTAAKLIQTVDNSKDAALLCLSLYENYYGNEYTFECFRGNTITRTAYMMMAEQAYLLWMQRSNDDDRQEVFKYLGALCGEKA